MDLRSEYWRMIRVAYAVPAAVLALATGCMANRPMMKAQAIPAPLVTALINDRGAVVRPSPAYVVGELPKRYPASLVPSGPVTIVGGMTNGDEIVAVFADSTRRLSAVLEDLFRAAGFVRPAPAPGTGFFPSSGPNRYFCRDSVNVSAEPLTGAERNFVRVNYEVQRGRRTCGFPSAPLPRTELRVPALTPPPGVRVGSSHAGGSPGVSSSTELFGAALEPSAIMAHYAAQLTSAGWVASAPAIGERVAVQFFRAKDDSGSDWEGTMTVVGSATGVTASLSMHVRLGP